MLTALLVCLIPTTIGALLSAIGIAGMDRLVQRNVLATSGRAVEAAGDIDTLLLDKTGTITFGNRQATELIPVGGTDRGRSRWRPGCPAWPTRPRRAAASSRSARASTACRQKPPPRRRARSSCRSPRRPGCPGSTSTDRLVRKGAAAAVLRWAGATDTAEVDALVERISDEGGTPWWSRRPVPGGDARCSASSGCPTWSSRVSRRGSPSCGRWASGR